MADNIIETMLSRVQNWSFRDAGVVQEILNVDTSEMEEVVTGGNQKINSYLKNHSNLDLVRGIVSHTLQVRSGSTSLDCVDVVNTCIADNAN